MKQLLGQDWYLDELGARNRNHASPLWNALMPTPAPADTAAANPSG